MRNFLEKNTHYIISDIEWFLEMCKLEDCMAEPWFAAFEDKLSDLSKSTAND